MRDLQYSQRGAVADTVGKACNAPAETPVQQANLQCGVLLDGAALAAIGGKPIHRHSQGQTALAMRASGAIDAQAAATKTLFDQFGINSRVCRCLWVKHLHARFFGWQIAAIVRCAGI